VTENPQDFKKMKQMKGSQNGSGDELWTSCDPVTCCNTKGKNTDLHCLSHYSHH